MASWYNELFGNPNAGLDKGANTMMTGYGQALNDLERDSANAQNMARQGMERDGRVLSQGNAQERLEMADKFRQDANQYEQDRAMQGVMAAYGGDPLSSGTKSQVTGALAQLARQNYGAALDRANAATDTNMNLGLNSSQNATANQLGIQGNLTNQRLSTKTALADSLASNQASRAGDGGIVGKVNNIVGSIF